MLTTKIRTSIISAVAALSIASLGPMTTVASALPPEGTQESPRCVELKHEFEAWRDLSNKFDEEGDHDSAMAAATIAIAFVTQAQNEGCPWGDNPPEIAPGSPTRPKTNQGFLPSPPRATGGFIG
jgi:hypothetical protein